MKNKIFQKLIIITVVILITISAPLSSYHIGQQIASADMNGVAVKALIALMWGVTQTQYQLTHDTAQSFNDWLYQSGYYENIELTLEQIIYGNAISNRVDTMTESELETYKQTLKTNAETELGIDPIESTLLNEWIDKAISDMQDGIVTLREMTESNTASNLTLLQEYINKSNTGIYNDKDKYIYDEIEYFHNYGESKKYCFEIHNNINMSFINSLREYSKVIINTDTDSYIYYKINIYFNDDSDKFKIINTFSMNDDRFNSTTFRYSGVGTSSFQLYKYINDEYETITIAPNSSLLDLINQLSLSTNLTLDNIDTSSLDMEDNLIIKDDYDYTFPSLLNSIQAYNIELNNTYNPEGTAEEQEPFIFPDINLDIPDNNISLDYDPETNNYDISGITDSLGEIGTGIDEGNDLTGETNTILQGIKDILDGIKSDTGDIVGEGNPDVVLEAEGTDPGGFGFFKFLNLILLILINILKYIVKFIAFVVLLSQVPASNNLISDPTLIAMLNWWKTNPIPVFNLSIMQIITGYLFLMMAIRIFSIIRGWIEKRSPNFSIGESEKPITSLSDLEKGKTYTYGTGSGSSYLELDGVKFDNLTKKDKDNLLKKYAKQQKKEQNKFRKIK